MFCHRYSHITDYLCGSVVICICIILLMPKVHDSFHVNSQKKHSHLDLQLEPKDKSIRNHYHQHEFPIGEVIISVGFLVFYCIGVFLNKTIRPQVEDPLSKVPRKISTTCCSSTRCPATQSTSWTDSPRKPNEFLVSATIHALPKQETSSLITKGLDEDCVLLLNRHHNHHMHTKHHSHTVKNHTYPSVGYGSTSSKDERGSAVEETHGDTIKISENVYSGEINISLLSEDSNNSHACMDSNLSWPRSIKVTILCIILASILIALDLNLQGLMEAIKVFRAAATGALLYLAFFLILPNDAAGCNSCLDENELVK